MTNQSDLSPIFHALADPTRRAVVEHLSAGPATVSDLATPHSIALPTFLRHLDVLEKSGLIQSEKKGRVRTCRIKPQALSALDTWVTNQRHIWDRRMDRLAQLADTIDRSH